MTSFRYIKKIEFNTFILQIRKYTQRSKAINSCIWLPSEPGVRISTPACLTASLFPHGHPSPFPGQISYNGFHSSCTTQTGLHMHGPRLFPLSLWALANPRSKHIQHRLFMPCVVARGSMGPLTLDLHGSVKSNLLLGVHFFRVCSVFMSLLSQTSPKTVL